MLDSWGWNYEKRRSAFVAERFNGCLRLHAVCASCFVDSEFYAGRWKLTIKWVNDNDRGCFDKIIQERGLVATETEDGYTTFLKPIESKQ